MRQQILLGLLFLAGCQNVTGPLEHRRPLRVDDPNLTIEEQQRRARDRLALPDITQQQDPGLEILPRGMAKGVQ